LQNFENAKEEIRKLRKRKVGKYEKSKIERKRFRLCESFARVRVRDSGTVAKWIAPPHSPVDARKGTTSIGFPEFMCVPNEATISACLFLEQAVRSEHQGTP